MKKFRLDYMSDIYGSMVKRIYKDFESEDKAREWGYENLPKDAMYCEVMKVKQFQE